VIRRWHSSKANLPTNRYTNNSKSRTGIEKKLAFQGCDKEAFQAKRALGEEMSNP